ncbi:MAG: hypothetical protein F2793_05035 [Actinobacteria bacterium]|uniref:Unannotated protein n=1 Tax=freshwater metagenome TaxID=449393 RepID=A0A6J7E771_9ZZZZ|nr:hypothetical protein [Actinomycetota bacterium]
MAKYECVDEMTIEATPSECFESLIDEGAGRTAWWEPYVVIEPKGEIPAGQPGAEMIHRASPDGTTDRYWSTSRMTVRVAEIERDRRIVLTEEDGDFQGFEEWTFEPMDGDRTLIRVHWVADPRGWMRLWSMFGGVVEDHSLIVREGLRGMERHVAQRRRTRG